MKNTLIYIVLSLSMIVSCSVRQSPVEQKKIARIESMPASPENFVLPDWKKIALGFDEYVYDFNSQGEYLPLIWLDSSKRNFPFESFGIYTAIGDRRQGPSHNNGEHHEAIGVLGSIYSATINGIDKSSQDGFNYVRMCQNYFNSSTGWNIIMNNTCPEAGALGGGYGRDFWYDVFPNMLFYAIGEHYPEVDGVDNIMRTVADQFAKADSIIVSEVGSYRIREFDFGRMTPGNRKVMLQSDAAAGFAYILYGAYKKYGDERYLMAALSAMCHLDAEEESQFYEVIMPFAVYMAARMNAEQKQTFDVCKYLEWTFDGQSKSRPGWGVLTGSFGDYDVDGMCGSVSEEYGFAMNTFALAWPLLPAVRYDQSIARAVGRWATNAVVNARYFYPQYVEPGHQELEDASVSGNVIAYEGFRRHDKYGKKSLEGVEGIAIGDGPQWVKGNPEESMISLYGSAYAGIFGAVARHTNVERIIQFDCCVTDYFPGEHYQTYLYYNPYDSNKSVRIDLGDERCDVYDIAGRTMLMTGKSGVQYFNIDADSVCVPVLLPSGAKQEISGGVLYVNGIPVDYNLNY